MQLIKEASTISEKEAFIDSAYRFTLTSLFALSASTAVLFNAYDHYKDLFEVDCVLFEKKKEALRMIQYQFTKIYDLKNICQSMKRLFQNLGSRSHNAMQKRSKNRKSRRLNRTSSTETMVRCMLKFVPHFNWFSLCVPHRFNFFSSMKFKIRLNWLHFIWQNHLRNSSAPKKRFREKFFGTVLPIHHMIHSSFLL